MLVMHKRLKSSRSERTSIAHCTRRTDNVISWPGGNNISSDKVPTELLYDHNNASVKWGYQIKPEETRLRCIKLLLDQRQALPSWANSNDLFDQLQGHGKTPVRAAADFLCELYKMANEELIKRFGDQMMSTTKIEYVLTVPAVWSDAAKNATLSAAELAGMGQNLRLISEPEAAAVHALTSMQNSNLSVGDVFVVCDAGGGTVDLISYEVQQIYPLRFREVVTGSGFLCGAAFLNLRFQELVKSRLGKDIFQDICQRKPKS